MSIKVHSYLEKIEEGHILVVVSLLEGIKVRNRRLHWSSV